ncbi:MAG: ABC transporter substrate-binding protein [Pseudomonadota bacterium]
MSKTKAKSFTGLWAAFFGAFVAWQVSIDNHAQADNPHANVLSIGNAVTEIVFALGEGHRLVARDSTSNYPPDALDLPNVGYMRALSAEGVLSVEPELILATEGAGPKEVTDVLRAAGISYVDVPAGFTAEAIAEKIEVVGEALNVEDKANALAQAVMEDIAAATSEIDESNPKRVMFLMSAAGGKLIAAGQDTGADAVIRLSGGINAVSGYTGYKTLEDEAAAAAAPDVILMMARVGAHDASAEDLFELPSLATSPAAANKALIKMDGPKILGFGPRTAEAIRELNAALYGG